MLWLISIIVWAGSWFGIFISYSVYGGYSEQYSHLVQITVMDLVCTDFIAVIFSIMGLILFRSSQVANLEIVGLQIAQSDHCLCDN